MAKTPIQQSDLNQTLSTLGASFVDVAKIAVPYTTVQNRAQIYDLANDLGTRMGVERIVTQKIYPIQTEQGPNGESVWGVEGDVLGQIRCVGQWFSTNNNYGAFIQNVTLNDYIEITFYGTGLNVLSTNHVAHDLRATIDGGTEGGSSIVTGASTVLGGRNYSMNVVFPVTSGLSLNFHTVKIRINNAANGLNFFGFEILNESSSLNVRPGSQLTAGRRLKLDSAQSPSYNTTFESGTLGTKGGHVLVYQKADGTIAKAVTPTDTSAAYLTSASHVNEEVSRIYNWREFGVGRADDFSRPDIIQGSPGRTTAFTLEDGTTTLVSNDARLSNSTFLGVNTSGTGFISFTFVGTGLDVFFVGGGSEAFDIYIDGGTSSGTLSDTAGVKSWKKVASGLPYGTHVVKFLSNANSGGAGLFSFKTYAPKKPTLPTGAVELAEYFVMANYSQVATMTGPTATDREKISSGVLRKLGARESVYVGSGWNNSVDTANFAGGLNWNTGTNADYYEYTFVGTGVDINGLVNAAVQNWTISIDGSSNLSGYTTSFKIGTTGTTFTASTGTVSGTAAAGARFSLSITGLSYGRHKIRGTRNGSDTFYNDAIDIISPIHCPKPNALTEIQNTFPIGNCSVGDLRKLPVSQPTAEKATAMVKLPAGISTTSSTYIPAAGLGLPFIGKNKKVRVSYSCTGNMSASNTGGLAIFVDGVQMSETKGLNNCVAPLSDQTVVTLSNGVHWIQVHLKCNGSTFYLYNDGFSNCTLSVEEL